MVDLLPPAPAKPTKTAAAGEQVMANLRAAIRAAAENEVEAFSKRLVDELAIGTRESMEGAETRMSEARLLLMSSIDAALKSGNSLPDLFDEVVENCLRCIEAARTAKRLRTDLKG